MSNAVPMSSFEKSTFSARHGRQASFFGIAIAVALAGIALSFRGGNNNGQRSRSAGSSSSSAAPLLLLPLHPIDRIKESQLDHDTFLEQYVKPGNPLIIVRDVTSDADEWGKVSSSLIEKCGGQKYSALSAPLRHVHASRKPWERRLLAWALRLAVGVDLDEWWAKRESVAFEDVRREASRNEDESVTTKIPAWVRAVAPTFLLRMLEVYTRPMYLADVTWYENQAQYCGVPTKRSLAEQRVVASLPTNNRQRTHRLFWMFWGGIDSALYPLHRDNNDRDVLIDVFEGCKDVVIVHPDERHHLTPMPVAGALIWSDDLFSDEAAARPASMERAWRGTVRSGETLFFPGDAIHEARNRCPNTLSSCTRPWHGAEVREQTFPAKFV